LTNFQDRAKIISFNTAASTSTRDNIIKVFGTKSLRDLITLDLKFQLQHDTSRNSTQYDDSSREVKVEGHISRPVFGEGRSAPDRQMFYVNSRPCGLPQVSKAFNDVYKSFNISQSPFVFANLIMDTKSYDVNVSPDKRTILLHDQGILLESLKEALMELFERQEQTVPQSKPTASVQPKLPDYRPLTVTRQPEAESVGADSPTSEHDSHTPDDETLVEPVTQKGSPERLIHNWVGRGAQDRDEVPVARSKPAVQNAFDRMRPQRTPQQVAEITIGDKTTKTVIGSGSYYTPQKRRIHIPNNSIAKKLSQYVMPGTQVETDEEGSGEESGPSQQVQKDADEDSDDEVLFVPQDDSQNSGREREGTPQLGSQTLEKSRTSPIDEYLRITKETDEDVQPSADDLEADYLDEEQNRIREDTKIARMIQKAEDEAARPSQDSIRRATQALKVSKHTTLNLIQTCYVSTASIARQSTLLSKVQAASQQPSKQNETATNHAEETDAEARLSLTVSKSDFTQMNIIGQFNLGFILAVRPCGKKVPSSSSSSSSPSSPSSSSSDLFIIDQHAADEKYNFERYTNSLTLEPQRLAQPKQLHLTAIEEEIVLAHAEALIANGFIISTDTSGASDVGTRCKLLALPMSKETTFDLDDLEELLYLLSDHQTGGGGDGGNSSSSSSSKSIPRPGKVRKMLAMRACRSSIMVGKTLTKGQMVKVVRNLGEMDKPWNCPHGRPTMRHLADLGGLGFNDEGMEKEDEEGGVQEMKSTTDWKGYIRRVRESEEVVSDVDVDVDGEEEEE
jgi:DNA mismatch repair protein PMS2